MTAATGDVDSRAALVVFALVGACATNLPDATDPAALAPLAQTNEARAAAARARAPDEHSRSPYAHAMRAVNATLLGNLSLAPEAQRRLHEAWRGAAEGSSTRNRIAATYGRFLNLWSAEGDLRHASTQETVYRSIAATRGASSPSPRTFEYDCFADAAAAASLKARGRDAAALRRVWQLERSIHDRLRARPEEMDTHAMAGNYALAFAAAIPAGRQRRLAHAIEHLEVQQKNWERLSAGARNEKLAPNVRTVFAFALAEASTAAGEPDRARAHYQALIDLTDVPSTAVRKQLVRLSQERLAHLPAVLGDERLLPVWPSGALSCVACHSREATLPETQFLRPAYRSRGLAHR